MNFIESVEAIVCSIPSMAKTMMDHKIAITQLLKGLTTAGNYTILCNEQADARETTEKPSEKSCCNAVKLEDKTVKNLCKHY